MHNSSSISVLWSQFSFLCKRTFVCIREWWVIFDDVNAFLLVGLSEWFKKNQSSFGGTRLAASFSLPQMRIGVHSGTQRDIFHLERLQNTVVGGFFICFIVIYTERPFKISNKCHKTAQLWSLGVAQVHLRSPKACKFSERWINFMT